MENTIVRGSFMLINKHLLIFVLKKTITVLSRRTYMKKLCLVLLSLLCAFSLYAKGFYTEDDIGKIVLKNGSIVTAKQYDKASYQAIGIVWKVADDGSCFWAIGINTIKAKWASENAYGCSNRIQGLEGLKDGSKALAIVRKADPEGTKNLQENYPALYYASIYGKKYDTGKFKDGWYIPALAELGSFDDNLYPWNMVETDTSEFEADIEIPGGIETVYKTKNSVYENLKRICDSFKLFNDTYPYTVRCSDSQYDGNPANSVSNWYLDGFASAGHPNDSEYAILVMRKFN